MDTAEHAERLRQAIASKGITKTALADTVGVGLRTVVNWTSTKSPTMPSEADRIKLHQVLGAYSDPGDPVEVAVRGSRLTEDRQYVVLGTYKRQLREQDEETEGRRTG